MSAKLTGKFFTTIVLAALLMFSPLNVVVCGAKGASEGTASPALEAKVKEALREHKDVKVEVNGADVVLRGYVNTHAEKNILENQIRGVPGVKYVRDKVAVRQDNSTAVEEFIEDAVVTTKVKAKILAGKGLDSIDISVTTVDGVVTLSGVVECVHQAELAAKVAHEVTGVKSVINKLTVQR